MIKLELKGQRFGRLIAIEEKPNRDNQGYVRWLCKCDCGNEKAVRGSHLIRKQVKSCGCLRHDVGKAKIHYAIAKVLKHGKSESRLHQIWRSMKQRCLNPRKSHYKYYGGRGILICKEWLTNFATFYFWATINGYSDNLDIDRIDNDGNYEPNNCRWITKEENSRRRWEEAAI
jgi:hypothetical protein